jgi:hypothetical protein
MPLQFFGIPYLNILELVTILYIKYQIIGYLQSAKQNEIKQNETKPIILSKFGSNWATGSRQEDFYVNFP